MNASLLLSAAIYYYKIPIILTFFRYVDGRLRNRWNFEIFFLWDRNPTSRASRKTTWWVITMRTDALGFESFHHIKINRYDNMCVVDSNVSASKKSLGPIKWLKMTAWMLALFSTKNIQICNDFVTAGRSGSNWAKKTFHFELDGGHKTVGILIFFFRNQKPTSMAFIWTTL